MADVARRSSFALILVLTLLAALAVQRSDAASTRNVSMVDNDFVPATITIGLGDTVLWKNNGNNPHTATGNAPLNLWNSTRLDDDETFSRVFGVAGTYPYFCDFHDGFGMVGNVRARIKTYVTSGAAGTRFALNIATATATSPFVYDVQLKVPGGAFTSFKVGTVAKKVYFNSTGRAAGVYQFRARLRNTGSGAFSGWSPVQSITVTS
jgi:plastocyanin